MDGAYCHHLLNFPNSFKCYKPNQSSTKILDDQQLNHFQLTLTNSSLTHHIFQFNWSGRAWPINWETHAVVEKKSRRPNFMNRIVQSIRRTGWISKVNTHWFVLVHFFVFSPCLPRPVKFSTNAAMTMTMKNSTQANSGNGCSLYSILLFSRPSDWNILQQFSSEQCFTRVARNEIGRVSRAEYAGTSSTAHSQNNDHYVGYSIAKSQYKIYQSAATSHCTTIFSSIRPITLRVNYKVQYI